MTKVKKTAKTIDNSNHEELENQLRRALADYQNLERRVSEERALLSTLTSALVIEKFLPVLDNLESAQKHLNDQGLALVIKQFKDVLISEGVEELDVEGMEFDPNLHEAAEVVEGDKDNVVVKVLSKGYKINDKIIRPARVAVSKNNQKSEETQEEEIPVEGGLNG